MERKIIFPKWEKDEILVQHVEEELEDRGGMILVYNNENVAVGHVVLSEGMWMFRTVNDAADAESLGEIMVDCSNYTFKLVT